jgi:hypothetical protein
MLSPTQATLILAAGVSANVTPARQTVRRLVIERMAMLVNWRNDMRFILSIRDDHFNQLLPPHLCGVELFMRIFEEILG